MMAGGPTFWMSKRQDVIVLSMTEAEYIAASKGVQQAKWVHQFLSEIDHLVPLPSLLRCDNQGRISLSKDPKFHSQVKHIDIRYHYVQDAVKKGDITIKYIPLADNLANALTKPLGLTSHHRQVGLMRLDL